MSIIEVLLESIEQLEAAYREERLPTELIVRGSSQEGTLIVLL